MMRTVFDIRTATWAKYGAIVFATDAADRDRQIAGMAGGATVTIVEEREATEAEVLRHAEYLAWLVRWQDAARRGKAGRHMANPGPRESDDSYRGGAEDDLPSDRWRSRDRRRW